jgi:hypothetical protein
MKKSLFVVLLALLSIGLSAQEASEAGWKKGGMGSVTFSQVSLTNWAAGGENSISANLLFNAFANYKKEKFTWDNTFDLGYGLLKQSENDARKTDDRIEVSSKAGQYAFKSWYYSGLVNFKTQMVEGYDYAVSDVNVISNFMAPAYLTIALGMDYKPNDDFTLLVAPLTGKMTIVNDDTLSAAGAFGVDPGENLRNEFGGFIKAVYKKGLVENVDMQTKLELFSNYMENPQNIDVNWELLLVMKINEFLTANLSTQLLYDDDVKIANDDGSSSPKIQFKEVFGVGLSYKF